MSPAQFTPRSVLTDEMFARAWHAVSSEQGDDAVVFDGPGCTCRNYGPRVRDVFNLLTGEPVPEPPGLGAVVINPLTDNVWVRADHPARPWRGPSVDIVGDWADPDPTSEDWLTWKELPGP